MHKNYLFFFFYFVFLYSTFSQAYSKEKIYAWHDQNLEVQNTRLFQGIEYVETDRVINDLHKFFETNEFQKGSITYGGQTYYDIPLKYNIYNDVLLVNLQQNLKNYIFQLIDNKVEQFKINETRFRYLKSSENSDIEGFYEVINEEGAFKVFKKHLKSRMEKRDKQIAYSEFKSVGSNYIFQFKNKYFELNNSKDLLTELQLHKNKIKSFYRKYRRQRRNSPDVFMKNLANEINTLISSTTNQIKE
ncbi:hypothetical protein GUB10_00765 [Salegentibacter sp. BLCTC]|uniref:DUF4468 domain-containing protein n=1 Tax=Salegentibacter maritimus TaxID=2794347 RepID=A0ABS0TCV3_9FLAO|nr:MULTISPECIES: hypothetical protein [Salegentibacter]MBE7638850.1 hypothetical protein [Salegentibacter sp. BLCTC]MBI6118874.1 hypothetical protein [Salegentibacter maritimus]